MNKFYVKATDGAVPSVKFKFLDFRKIKIFTDEIDEYFLRFKNK
jgi:hypothetical protein